MYILGAENEEKNDDQFEYVPYSKAVKISKAIVTLKNLYILVKHRVL